MSKPKIVGGSRRSDIRFVRSAYGLAYVEVPDGCDAMGVGRWKELDYPYASDVNARIDWWHRTRRMIVDALYADAQRRKAARRKKVRRG